MLELWCSPPGTGKTHACIELFRKEILKTKSGIESRSFFILPNREHAERIQNLILKTGVPGLFNVHILTIQDFASQLLGVRAGRGPSDGLRLRLVDEILNDPKLHFEYFDQVKSFKGFHRLLADTIREFKAGLLTAREFERRAQPLLKDEVFRQKFKDFSVLFKNYEKRLEALGLEEAEDNIPKLARSQESLGWVDLVIFDGFYHFTRAQMALIESVQNWSRRVVVTLTLPQNASRRLGVFEYPLKTKESLLAAGFKLGSQAFGKNYRVLDPALLHLERNLFLENPAKYPDAQKALCLLEAPSLEAEIDMIARQARTIYRQGNVHYSDICVILRNVSAYQGVLEKVFGNLGIPIWVHERKKLIEQGLIKTVYRFLKLLSEDWKREDLLYVLKSSYVRKLFDWREVLELEAAAYRQNLSQGKDVWAAFPVARALLELGESLLSSHQALVFKERLFSLVRRFQISGEDTAENIALASLETIFKNAAAYYQSSLRRDFTAANFVRELEQSLEDGLFSQKPPGKNRVQIYDVVMALPKEYKVVFMAGLLEKVFPQNVVEDPLFKDQERRLINREATALEERGARLSGERNFFYMGITRAKEKLYFSYPLYDVDGRPALPSFFVEEVKKCFPKDAIPVFRKNLNDLLPSPEEWMTEDEITQGLSERWPGISEELPELAREWQKREDFGRALEAASKTEPAAGFTDPAILKIFQDIRGPFSATKLETFATCAFKYFASRMLHLNESPEGRQALEMGNILHKALDEFYKGLSVEDRQSGKFWEDTQAALDRLCEKLESLMAESSLAGQPLYRQKIYADSMRGILALFARQEKEFLKSRALAPSYFEWEFGKGQALEVAGPDGPILIEGKIDRIDLTPDGAKALVIDYKRSRRPQTIREKWKKGLEFQIPIYLLAVRKILGLDVLGGELRFLRDSGREGLYLEEARGLLGLGPRAAVCKKEEFEEILAQVEKRIAQVLARLRDADISVQSKTCDHCQFGPVCRFEKWKLIYE
jgi:ATP-dependent helicase/nuclease subunit B